MMQGMNVRGRFRLGTLSSPGWLSEHVLPGFGARVEGSRVFLGTSGLPQAISPARFWASPDRCLWHR